MSVKIPSFTLPTDAIAEQARRANVDRWVELWLERLRDPKSKQGKDRLVDADREGGMCCLGHLCDIFSNAGYGSWVGVTNDVFRIGNHEAKHQFPAIERDPMQQGWTRRLYVRIDECNDLTFVNDCGKYSLADIADIIESGLVIAPWGGPLYLKGYAKHQPQ